VHAPPQHGKSILISQRFPAWLLGIKPTERIRLACYNITHATRFSRITLQLMQDGRYRRIFPREASHVPANTSGEEWSTAARRSLADAQPSMKALGLVTGFVGQGADTLIIDDPYASPQDAASEAIRESVWMFWNESARVRLSEDANVVVMFHRYREDDLAGRLWATGEWEMLRYSARADNDPEFPADPMEREFGEKLSPRFSEEYYHEQEAQGFVWLSQFQGAPVAKDGEFFKTSEFEILPAVPAPLGRKVRAWDLAATANGGDWTVGVKMASRGDGRYVILDVKRGRWSPEERDKEIRQTAALDGPTVTQRFPQDPGQAGKSQTISLAKLCPRSPLKFVPPTGAKEVRAGSYAGQVNVGNVALVEGDWNTPFIAVHRLFPRGSTDDDVDAAADAYNELTEKPKTGKARVGGEKSAIARPVILGARGIQGVVKQ
jgi:predicted phage terminase large subunit-like protein